MKVTGYKLREAIGTHELRRDGLSAQFADSFKKFKDEEKQTPVQIGVAYRFEETAIARLQAAQTKYNTLVEVSVEGHKMTLLEAVKRQGGVSRLEALWKTAPALQSAKTKARFAMYRETSGDDVRDPTKERAIAVMKPEDITKELSAVAKSANALKSAIGAGNATEVDLEGLDLSLFE